MRTFNPKAKREARAYQAWLILIGHARERRTLTYEMLGREMFGRPAQGVLGHILGCVAFYCMENDLPPLNCIVVGKGRGTPGHEIPESSDRLREAVYAYRWFDLYPPLPEELAAAFARAST
jgi:hypothetical protein